MNSARIDNHPGAAHVRVRGLTKTFALAEQGGRAVSLREALRAVRHEQAVREVRALQGLSFDIGEGERVGIIGRNGAGKTTLLSLLSGVTDPTAGTVEVAGKVHAMLTVGAVLRDDMTGRENIYLDATIHGETQGDIDAHVEAVIAFSELGEFIDRPVRTYSTGMKGRLAFSMGAFIEPDVLIIDETLSVGDAFFADKATRRMKEIAAQGRIVIVVSHALEAINEICDRCLWLDKGRLVMDGPAQEVTKAYVHAVEQADEAELAAKFGSAGPRLPRSGSAGRLAPPVIEQEDKPLAATARAFVPLRLALAGTLTAPAGPADIALTIQRVDGRRIFSRKLSATGQRLPERGEFAVSIAFDPLILGAGLYRFEVTLLDETGPIDAAARVFEIVDEEGQFGGVPLLYCPPIIKARPLGGTL
jgi:lipopolysaccharide transport system ATP-binding protein